MKYIWRDERLLAWSMKSSHCLTFLPLTRLKQCVLVDLEEMKIMIDNPAVSKLKLYEMLCRIRRNSRKTKRLRLTEFSDIIGRDFVYLCEAVCSLISVKSWFLWYTWCFDLVFNDTKWQLTSFISLWRFLNMLNQILHIGLGWWK